MFLRNCWYVGAWSHEIAESTLLSRKLLGERIAFFRKEDGSIAALRDRCGHRFAPLSKGRKEGDCVRCMYHGLVFDSSGKCVEEPGHKRPIGRLGVRAYPVQERWNQVWIWIGDPALANADLIPECHFQSSPEWASIPSYLHYDADYRLLIDNLLDFSHLSYVHERTLGGSTTIAATRPQVEKIDGGVCMTRWYLGEPGLAPYLNGFGTFQGPVDRWHIYEMRVAGNVFIMDSGSAPAGTGAPQGRRVPEAMQFRSIQIITPEDEHHSHYFWIYAHGFNLHDSDFTRKLTARIAEGFAEDKAMIEAQQAVIREYGEQGMGFIRADEGLAMFRRFLEEKLHEEQEAVGRHG